MLTIQYRIIIFSLLVGNIVPVQINQVPSREENILSFHDRDRGQLTIFSDGFNFDGNCLGVDLTITFNKGEITIEFYR